MNLENIKGLAELNKFLQELPPKLERNRLRGALRAGAKAVLPVARSNVHSVSGKLAGSLKVRSDAKSGMVTAKVYTRVFYAKFVEYGTKPHTIRAKDGGALAFGGGFREFVEHKGSRGFGFMRNALDTQAGAAVTATGEYLKRVLATKDGLDTADIEIEVGE